MKRFDYDDDDFDENLFSDTDDEGDQNDEYEMIVDQDAVNAAQLALIEQDLNQKLLARAIKMVNKKWWPPFKSDAWRLKKIEDIYKFLKNLMDGK